MSDLHSQIDDHFLLTTTQPHKIQNPVPYTLPIIHAPYTLSPLTQSVTHIPFNIGFLLDPLRNAKQHHGPQPQPTANRFEQTNGASERLTLASAP